MLLAREHWALRYTQDTPVIIIVDEQSAPSKGLALHGVGTSALLPAQRQLQPELPSGSSHSQNPDKAVATQHASWNHCREQLELPNSQQGIKMWLF